MRRYHRDHSRSATQSIETDLDLVYEGRDLLVSFTRVTTFSHDPNADCDADGNRGHAVDYVDEDYAEGIVASEEDDLAANQDKIRITPLDKLPPAERTFITNAVDAWLEKNPPEWENYGDEYLGPDTWEEARRKW